MKRSQRLKIVLDLAQREEEIQARACADQRAQLEQAGEKRRQLEDYLAEYQAMTNRPQDSLDISAHLSARAFMARLGEALAWQKAEILRQAEHLDTLSTQWINARHHLQQLERLMARYRDEEAREADHREQKVMDELATQAYARRQSALKAAANDTRRPE